MTTLTIRAEAIEAKHLKPGDLFSTAGEAYWNNVVKNPKKLGEVVYLRTGLVEDDGEYEGGDDLVYRLTITVEGESQGTRQVMDPHSPPGVDRKI